MPRKKRFVDTKDSTVNSLGLVTKKEIPSSLTETFSNLSQIERLIHLQQIDQELHELRQRLRCLDQNIVKARSRLVKIKFKRARIARVQVKAKKKLVSIRSRIKKIKLLLGNPSQQDRVALNTKLKLFKADKTKFRGDLQRLEDKRIRLRKRARDIQDRLKTWMEERRKIRQLFKEQQEGLEAQHKVIENLIEPYLLRSYEKLLERYNSQAVVRVTEGVCDGCHTMIPSCVVGSLVGKRIVTCEVCQRFLYFTPTPLEPSFDLKALAVEERRRVYIR
jgi:hypothetical protein